MNPNKWNVPESAFKDNTMTYFSVLQQHDVHALEDQTKNISLLLRLAFFLHRYVSYRILFVLGLLQIYNHIMKYTIC